MHHADVEWRLSLCLMHATSLFPQMHRLMADCGPGSGPGPSSAIQQATHLRSFRRRPESSKRIMSGEARLFLFTGSRIGVRDERGEGEGTPPRAFFPIDGGSGPKGRRGVLKTRATGPAPPSRPSASPASRAGLIAYFAGDDRPARFDAKGKRGLSCRPASHAPCARPASPPAPNRAILCLRAFARGGEGSKRQSHGWTSVQIDVRPRPTRNHAASARKLEHGSGSTSRETCSRVLFYRVFEPQNRIRFC